MSFPTPQMINTNGVKLEVFTAGPTSGKALTRILGHIAYWFAWNGYFSQNGELAQ